MSKLGHFISKQSRAKSIDDLSSEGLVLFNFITLLVDIRHRAKYGHYFERQRGRGYSKAIKDNEVLPSQIPSVDIGLEDLQSTENV